VKLSGTFSTKISCRKGHHKSEEILPTWTFEGSLYLFGEDPKDKFAFSRVSLRVRHYVVGITRFELDMICKDLSGEESNRRC